MAKYPVFASKWRELRDAAEWLTAPQQAAGLEQFNPLTRRATTMSVRTIYKWQAGTGRPTARQLPQLVAKLTAAGYPLQAAEQIVEHLMDDAFSLAEFRRILSTEEQPPPLDLTNPIVAQWRETAQQEKDHKRILDHLEWLKVPANWDAARARMGDGPAGRLLDQIKEQNTRADILRKLEIMDRRIKDSLD